MEDEIPVYVAVFEETYLVDDEDQDAPSWEKIVRVGLDSEPPLTTAREALKSAKALETGKNVRPDHKVSLLAVELTIWHRDVNAWG